MWWACLSGITFTWRGQIQIQTPWHPASTLQAVGWHGDVLVVISMARFVQLWLPQSSELKQCTSGQRAVSSQVFQQQQIKLHKTETAKGFFFSVNQTTLNYLKTTDIWIVSSRIMKFQSNKRLTGNPTTQTNERHDWTSWVWLLFVSIHLVSVHIRVP